MAASVKLLRAGPEDNGFLYLLFTEDRRPSLQSAGWDVRQQDLFLQQQFALQQRAYREHFPDAAHFIVHDDNGAIGGILVASGADEIRLVDVNLLPMARNRGIGGELLRAILSQGRESRRPVRLHVLQGNRAINLYLRLGFQAASSQPNGLYVSMEKLPD